MKILKIDHIGIAAKSIDQVAPFWNAILGLPIEGRETVEEQKATTAFLPVGESEIEILESTAPDGAIAKFVESRGEGDPAHRPAGGQHRAGAERAERKRGAADRRKTEAGRGRGKDRLHPSQIHQRGASGTE
jgi:catechol 2,3-dioxygenase-like lactoylglutathione lyase family enzyme